MKKQIKIYISIIILFFVFSVVPVFAVDGTYHALEPGVFSSFVAQTPSNNPLQEFFGQVFKFGIAAAVALALIMIIWGGIEYMTTDAWYNKEEGVTKIKDALIGLGMALASYLILFIVNPCLVVFNADKSSCTTTNTFLAGVPGMTEKDFTAGKIQNKEQVVDGKTMPIPFYCVFTNKNRGFWAWAYDNYVDTAPQTIGAYYRVVSTGPNYNDILGPYWFAGADQNSFLVNKVLEDFYNKYYIDKNSFDSKLGLADRNILLNSTFKMADKEKCQLGVDNYNAQLNAYMNNMNEIHKGSKQ